MSSISRVSGNNSRLEAIEKQARFLQLRLWNERSKFWPGAAPTHPLNVLEPGVALKATGYSVRTELSLGEMILQGRRIEVAGLIDRREKIVSVSSRFSKAEQLFTTAHELGHAVLHPHGAIFHRDRPLDPVGWGKTVEETEADWFAASFLMPKKQVESFFEMTFLTKQFILNDDTAFALCTRSLDVVVSRLRSRRDLSMLLARANLYGGRSIRPLAEVFRVSPTAMAYRLEQFDLVAEPNFKLLRA